MMRCFFFSFEVEVGGVRVYCTSEGCHRIGQSCFIV